MMKKLFALMLSCFVSLCAVTVMAQPVFAEDESETENRVEAENRVEGDGEEIVDADEAKDEAEVEAKSHSLAGRWYIEGQISLSILTDKIDSSYFAETFGFSVTAGYGLTDNLMIIVVLEQNNWKRGERGGKWDPGVFNAGIGALYQVFEPHVYIRLSAGTSTLTFDSPLDSIGTTGAYVDFVPIEIHWEPIDDLVLALRPLSIHLDAPVISDPGIHYVQYRTSFSVGYLF